MKINYKELKGLKKGKNHRAIVRIDYCCMDLIEAGKNGEIKVDLENFQIEVEDHVNNPDATLECPYCLGATTFEKVN